MISPESLRRYNFSAGLTDTQLKEIAMIAEEVVFEKGTTIFKECDDATNLFILKEGSVDLFYQSEQENYPSSPLEYPVGEINPGEIFGISAFLEPWLYTATARAARTCSMIKIDANALRKMSEDDPTLGLRVIRKITKALMDRLGATRIQLAAAWSD